VLSRTELAKRCLTKGSNGKPGHHCRHVWVTNLLLDLIRPGRVDDMMGIAALNPSYALIAVATQGVPD